MPHKWANPMGNISAQRKSKITIGNELYTLTYYELYHGRHDINKWYLNTWTTPLWYEASNLGLWDHHNIHSSIFLLLLQQKVHLSTPIHCKYWSQNINTRTPILHFNYILLKKMYSTSKTTTCIAGGSWILCKVLNASCLEFTLATPPSWAGQKPSRRMWVLKLIWKWEAGCRTMARFQMEPRVDEIRAVVFQGRQWQIQDRNRG